MPSRGTALRVLLCFAIDACARTVSAPDDALPVPGDAAIDGGRASRDAGRDAGEPPPLLLPDWLEPGADTSPIACQLVAAPVPKSRPAAEACGGGCAAHDLDGEGSAEPVGECARHADCRDGVNGVCESPGGFSPGPMRCVYDECFEDEDCGEGALCMCGDGSFFRHNTCLRAGCTTDDACSEGSTCAMVPSPITLECGPRQWQFQCTSDDDECQRPQDCPQPTSPSAFFAGCVFDAEAGHLVCAQQRVCPG